MKLRFWKLLSNEYRNEKYVMINKAINKLKKITSSYSFIRVLCLINLYENTNLASITCHKLEDGSKRLINQEIAFLAGLWLDNINFKKPSWKADNDLKYVDEVYRLLNIYHKSFTRTSYGEIHKEVAVYEGDGGYHWQFLDFAEIKYIPAKEFLQTTLNYDINFVKGVFYKLMKKIQSNFIPLDYSLQFLNNSKGVDRLYTVHKNEIQKDFSPAELAVLSKYCIKLGEETNKRLADITTLNAFNRCPIIILPNGNYLITNFYILAKSMCESPYYWICDAPNSKLLLSKLGESSEKIATTLLNNLSGNKSVYHNILIQKVNSKLQQTDIDVLLKISNDVFIFQVKNKKLTQKSIQGNETSISKDFNNAVTDAYNQGVICANALNKYMNYKGLEAYVAKGDKYHIICLTSEYFPTLTATVYESLMSNSYETYPLVAMSLYDLETMTYLFDSDELKDYFLFREHCAKLRIYADNDIFYVGKFIALLINPDEPYLFKGEKLPRGYGMIVDCIAQTFKYRRYEGPVLNRLTYLINDKSSDLCTNLASIFSSIKQEPHKICM